MTLGLTGLNALDLVQPPAALAGIEARTHAIGFDMASEPRTGALLRALAASKPGGILLELGTGTGVATAWLLAGMDAHSRLIPAEQDQEPAALAQAHLGEDPRVTFYVEDAGAVLGRLAGERFDLIFADSWAGKYTHLEETLGLG